MIKLIMAEISTYAKPRSYAEQDVVMNPGGNGLGATSASGSGWCGHGGPGGGHACGAGGLGFPTGFGCGISSGQGTSNGAGSGYGKEEMMRLAAQWMLDL